MQRKAQLQRNQDKYESAEKSLAAAMRLAAALADLHGTLGGTLREQGRLAEASSQYDQGYRLDQRYGIEATRPLTAYAGGKRRCPCWYEHLSLLRQDDESSARCSSRWYGLATIDEVVVNPLPPARTPASGKRTDHHRAGVRARGST